MKKSLCVLLFVLLAGCAYTAVNLEDEPQELLLVYEPEEISDTLPFIEYETALRTTEISPFGRQVAADFLGDFWSLFAGEHGWRDLETGIFYVWSSEAQNITATDYPPKISLGGRKEDTPHGYLFTFDGNSVFDRNGNPITGMPFMRPSGGSYSIARRFAMYAIDESGIPIIVVHFIFDVGNFFSYCGPTVVFKFVDGAYRKAGTVFCDYELFFNTHGEIILFSNEEYHGNQGYYYLRFENGEVEIETLRKPVFEYRQEWDEHHRYPYFHANPTIFGCGTPLTRIPPLLDLWHEIREEFQHGLTAANANANETHDLAPPQTEQQAAILALEEFLHPRHTIFDLGRAHDSGALISIFLDDELYTVIYNRYGERIEWPEYARGCCIPVAFDLYDFCNTGIPAVLLVYVPSFHGGSFSRLYRFIDGEYVAQENSSFCSSSEFFADRNGRIVVFEHNEYMSNFSFRYLDFTDTDIETTYIICLFDNLDWYSDNRRDEWEKLWFDWIEHITSPEWYTNPTIFRMPEETLTRIPRLTELEEQLTASIRRTHGLD